MGFLDELGTGPGADAAREPQPPSTRRARLALLMAAVLLVAGYVALHRYATDRALFGTKVEGIGIGGLDARTAADRLRTDLAPRLARPVVVTHDDRRYPFDPAAAGMRLDVARTLRDAGVRSSRWTPAALWRFLTGGHDHRADVHVDAARFTAALDALTAKVGQPLVEGDVRFVDGHARAVFGQPGLTVDHARTQSLVARLAFEGHPGELPVVTRRPYVGPEAVRAALRRVARPAMAAPVVLDFGGHRVRVPAAVLGQALDMVPAEGRLALLVDADHLADLAVARSVTLGPRPVSATVGLRDGRPVVVPAVDGITFDHQQLADGLPAVLRRPPGHRVLEVHAVLQPPHRTTAGVQSWRIRRPLAHVTLASGGHAASALDGTVIRPGRSLHLRDRIGTTDRALATELFTLALHAGVPVLDSTVPHRYEPPLPAGLERTDVTLAAPADTGLFLSVTDASSGPQLTIWGAPGPRVRVSVGGHKDVVPAPVHRSAAAACVPRAGAPGFSMTVRRRIRGHPVERFVSRYAPVPAVVCVPAPSGPSSSPSASTSGAVR